MLVLLAFLIVLVSNGTYLFTSAALLRRLGSNAGTIDGKQVEGSLFSRSDKSLLLKAYLMGGVIVPDTQENRDAVLLARWLMVISLISFAAFIVLLQTLPPIR